MIKNTNGFILEMDKAIYWLIIGLPFVASFSSAAVNIFIVLLLLVFILKRVVLRKLSLRFNPLLPFFFIIIVFSMLSFANSVNFRSSIQGIAKLLKYGFLILALASEINDREHLKKIIISSIFGLFLASFDGIYQLVFGVDLFRGKPYDLAISMVRLKAAFPHTNIFAGYLVLFIPLAIILAMYVARKRIQIILSLISFLGVFCLMWTFSRSAVFGIWLGLLILSAVKKNKALPIVLVLLVLVAPFFTPKSIRNWSRSTSSISEFLLNKERLPIFETSLNMIKHHPFVGVGVNTYCLNYQNYKLHDTSAETANTDWYAHNSYLQMASEIGLIGFMVFLLLLLALLSGWIKFYRRSKDLLLKESSLGIIIGLFAFLVHGLTETNLYYPKIAVLFWFQVALLASIIYFKKEGKNG